MVLSHFTKKLFPAGLVPNSRSYQHDRLDMVLGKHRDLCLVDCMSISSHIHAWWTFFTTMQRRQCSQKGGFALVFHSLAGCHDTIWKSVPKIDVRCGRYKKCP